MDVLHWILAAFSAVAGSGTFVSLLMYRKASKRQKNAEAFEKEVASLQAAQNVYKDQLNYQGSRIDALQREITTQDARMRELREDNNILEIKHAKNKSAINKAHECTFCNSIADCPVLRQRTKNEEEYVAQIEKRTKNVDSNHN